MEIITTFIVCLANCSEPISRDDEIGYLARKYIELCTENYYISKNHCPKINKTLLLQCSSKVQRELTPSQNNQFIKGLPILQKQLEKNSLEISKKKFSIALQKFNGEKRTACTFLINKNNQEKFDIFRLLKIMQKKKN
tara:strand:+ start:317 stop:730 length:414 start_codon:yes stop_codon:yes gene_type:complete